MQIKDVVSSLVAENLEALSNLCFLSTSLIIIESLGNEWWSDLATSPDPGTCAAEPRGTCNHLSGTYTNLKTSLKWCYLGRESKIYSEY